MSAVCEHHRPWQECLGRGSTVARVEAASLSLEVSGCSESVNCLVSLKVTAVSGAEGHSSCVCAIDCYVKLLLCNSGHLLGRRRHLSCCFHFTGCSGWLPPLLFSPVPSQGRISEEVKFVIADNYKFSWEQQGVLKAHISKMALNPHE